MKKYYLNEFLLYDGYNLVTFNIMDINTAAKVISLAVTDGAGMSVRTFSLQQDVKGQYFEYGFAFDKMPVDDFGKLGN